MQDNSSYLKNPEKAWFVEQNNNEQDYLTKNGYGGTNV